MLWDGSMKIGKWRNMEEECGDTSDFLVVVCLQKKIEFFYCLFSEKKYLISFLNDIQKQMIQ